MAKKKKKKIKNKSLFGKNLAETYKKLQLPSFEESVRNHLLFKT